VYEEPPDALDRRVLLGLVPGARESGAHAFEVADDEPGMRLPCRRERLFDADVELLRPGHEPDASPAA